MTWGWAVVFTGYSGFLHNLQLASHELATVGINVTKNEIPNPNPLDVALLIETLCLKLTKTDAQVKQPFLIRLMYAQPIN